MEARALDEALDALDGALDKAVEEDELCGGGVGR
jgi:hypothetical protein